MRIAIFESIMTPGGHEVEFDRLCVDELRALGHEVTFYVPSKHHFQCDYGVPIHYLPGDGISYAGVGKLTKIWYSAKREINRVRWFNSLYHLALQKTFDLVIVPTASYRFLRSATISQIRKSPVPVIFIVHGVTAKDATSFFSHTDKLSKYPNMKVAVLTPEDDVFKRQIPNMYCLRPPTYVPRDLPQRSTPEGENRLRLGFFGQYRREKNLEGLLDIFLSANFPPGVDLLVQGVTVDPADNADFKRIQQKYQCHKQIQFLHKALIGREWQEAIMSVDALVLPYAAERFRYQPSAMLFTAIGFQKPVVVADNMNPGIMQRYNIGVQFSWGDQGSLGESLRKFVNTYDAMRLTYRQELERANADCAPRKLAAELTRLAQ